MKKTFLIVLALIFFVPKVYAQSVTYCKSLYDNRQFANASACFYSLVQSDKNNPTYKLGYGNSLFAQKRYNEAKVQYNEIIQRFPSSREASSARNNLAVTNETLKTIKTSGKTDSGSYVSGLKNAKWTVMPIKVWIDSSEYSASVRRAFNEWQNRTGALVSFNFVQNPKEANIVVRFKSDIGSTATGEKLGVTRLAMSNGVIRYSEIDLKTTTLTGVKQSQSGVYSVALHEVGHALGITGHSDNKYDVMYPSDDNYRNTLSNRDVNTVKDIYK